MRRFGLATPHMLAWIVLFALTSSLVLAQDSTRIQPVKKEHKVTRPIVFDGDALPPEAMINPYNILAAMTVSTAPVLNHLGKPHSHGDVIQLIVDGGNGLQDPPNADGSPGGDDSLAYGNFNMIRLLGLEEPFSLKGASGLFFSAKYFIPWIQPPRAYYLRLWEGDNVATAPYYQDSVEYSTGYDNGGAMITLREGTPMDVEWKFGPSKPRPPKAAVAAPPQTK